MLLHKTNSPSPLTPLPQGARGTRVSGAKNNRAGFTLLELLLVVGILVMLAAFALPSFMGTQKQAQVDAATSQIDLFENALTLYQSQNNFFPTTDQGLKALLEKPEDDPVPEKWAGPYLNADNLNDPWGSEYQYAFEGEHNGANKPDIWSFGPDRQDGTDDDVSNWKKEGEETTEEK